MLLIHNPGAGDEEHDADHLARLLARPGHDVDYRSRDDDWKAALEERRDLVAVAGGDGTVNEVFKELAGSPLAATLIPLGTANNLAAGLGLGDAEPEELVADWRCAVLRPFDVGEAITGPNRRRFVEAAGGGLFAELFRRAEESRGGTDDKIRLGLELLREALERTHSSPWEVELDGADLSGDFLGVEAMNVAGLGPGIPLAPGADPGDGLLDVVLIAEEHRASLRDYVEARLADERVPALRLTAHRGRALTLRPADEPSFHVDDDPWEDAHGTVVFRTGTQHVNVLVPPPPRAGSSG